MPRPSRVDWAGRPRGPSVQSLQRRAPRGSPAVRSRRLLEAARPLAPKNPARDVPPLLVRSPPRMPIRTPIRLRRLLAWIASLAIVASLAQPAAAKPKPKDTKPAAPAGGAPAAGGAGDKPFAEWNKLTKDAEQKKGFFTLWKKRDNLYLELTKDQLE